MLSDNELEAAYLEGVRSRAETTDDDGSGWDAAGLRAVEAAVRKDYSKESDRKVLEALMEQHFPRVEPWEKRNPPMRGDDQAVDKRDDERAAVDEFIDLVLAAGFSLSQPVPVEAITESILEAREFLINVSETSEMRNRDAYGAIEKALAILGVAHE